MAGKRKGKEDSRHLWPQMLRAIREIAPKYIVGENVLGLVNWDGGLVFDEVQADLESEGYEVAAVVIPAAAVNAPHGRDRVWFVAYNNGIIRGDRGKLKSREQSRYGKSNEKSNTTFNRLATDTDNTRNTTSRCEIERNRTEESEEREYSQPEFNGHGIDGLTADTTSLRHRRWCKQSITNQSEERQMDCHQEGNWDGVWSKVERCCGSTSDTDSNGFHQCNCEHEINASEGGEYAQCDTNTSNVDGDAADTNGIGLRGQGDRVGSARFNGKNSEGNNWQNFPTQPPICGGDDGLSRELDGITFSKWRNESIRAYGNAIVPHVALEIFKVIQSIETQS